MTLGVVVGVVAILIVLYGTWTARRLDRLHARVDGAAAGLETQLRARAEAAAELAREMPAARGGALAEAAQRALATAGRGPEREAVENAVTRELQDLSRLPDPDRPVVRKVADASLRASFARSFYNDAVSDALVVRHRWVVRLLHLAGRAPRPTYFEIADAPMEIEGLTPASAPYD
jgi:hypothetical protein